MKFKVREGYKLFKSHDDAAEFETRGSASGIRPRAVGGDVVDLRPSEVSALYRAGRLGRLEPVDQEAIQAFGDTAPQVSRVVSNPELFIPPAPTPEPADFRFPERH